MYLELHPTEDIVVIESSSSCGGTWSKDRIYAGLKTNNLVDAYEYPDFPMAEERYGVKPKQHIPGAVCHEYLTDFAKKFGVFDRMQFNTRVDTIKPSSTGGWTLQCTSTSEKGQPVTKTVSTKKLILATGLTSTPNMPNYQGAETFGAPLFHAKDFCSRGDTIKNASRVVVVGGAKSAYDVSWAYVNAGATVDLVIRPDGNGPVWIAPAWVMGGGKRLEKLLHVRWMTWFSPSPFVGTDGYSWPRKFLHGTAIGRWIVDKFWGMLKQDVVDLNGYNNHQETKKLLPWHPVFWIGSGLSIHNYDTNFFEMVRTGKVRVHIANIASLSEKTVHLSTGESLPADVMICATGWKKESNIKFLDLPPSGTGLPQSEDEQKLLAAQADAQILRSLPRLKTQPNMTSTQPKPANPLRLYRFIAPPALMPAHNLAFAGMVSTVSTAICATVQALWISAFLDNALVNQPDSSSEAGKEAIAKEVMLHTQWGKWRHPTGYGASLPDFAFDAIPYTDLLLRDLGLKVRRKGGDDGGWFSWVREISEPYGPPDYVGLVDEFKEGRKG